MLPALSNRGLTLAAAVAAACFAFPPSAPCQEVGVKAGFNSASLTPEEDEEPNISRRIGPIGGVWFRAPATGRYSFQAEGLFSEKGVKFDVLGLHSNIRLRYVEIPLLARADYRGTGSAVRGFVIGGAAPAFNVSARGTARFEGEEQSRDIGDQVNVFDLGLVGGAGLEFGRAVIEARYTHGLLHINTDDNGDQDRVKNRVFSVLFGFRLR